jgi:hypothetical protein
MGHFVPALNGSCSCPPMSRDLGPNPARYNGPCRPGTKLFRAVPCLGRAFFSVLRTSPPGPAQMYTYSLASKARTGHIFPEWLSTSRDQWPVVRTSYLVGFRWEGSPTSRDCACSTEWMRWPHANRTQKMPWPLTSGSTHRVSFLLFRKYFFPTLIKFI